MTKTVDFIFDFASPNAYLVHHAIPEIEARTGEIHIQAMPFGRHIQIDQ